MSVKNSLIIIGLPRSGTSLVTSLCIDVGYNPNIFEDSKFFGGSPYNPKGYQEEVRFTLLNDQLIRSLYGPSYSFLYPPKFNIKKDLSLIPDDFHYDINESTLSIPDDYESKVKFYSGSAIDYWGLTRMRSGEKWFKGYAKFGVSTGSEIKDAVRKYSERLSEKNGLIIKDPRLCLSFNLYDFENCKFIFVERSFDKVVSSMKRHYGLRLFSNSCFKKFDWVSNHFNLQVKPMATESLLNRYQYSINKFRESVRSYFNLSYDLLVSKDRDHISELEGFISGKIDESKINSR